VLFTQNSKSEKKSLTSPLLWTLCWLASEPRSFRTGLIPLTTGPFSALENYFSTAFCYYLLCFNFIEGSTAGQRAYLVWLCYLEWCDNHDRCCYCSYWTSAFVVVFSANYVFNWETSSDGKYCGCVRIFRFIHNLVVFFPPSNDLVISNDAVKWSSVR